MNSFEILFRYIEKKSSLSLKEDDKVRIQEKFKPKKLHKKQYFLQEGDVCKYMGFIVSGATRMFRVDQKGHEHVLKLAVEEFWTGDHESFKQLTPSPYYVEAVENVNMLMVSNAQLDHLIHTIPAIAAMMNVIYPEAVITINKRILAAISLTAEERYDDLCKTNPEFLHRFPQGMIASYLGVSGETLSRLKKVYLKAQ
ncbi:Crp/Fnr family transcriptional regulator [Mucilaginibacter angelicae]|uniref:Crp/Fnr family transcriptional regulator n=1 Tax=Mucilaginibacter angelicae TaxID=869718 RepID=A0ABV6L7S2_9SPHI